MQGFQLTFFTEEGRRHAHQPVHLWLMDLARALGITGITTRVDALGRGRDGRLHAAHFIELADQPVEVTMALSPAQCAALFERLEAEQANLFYVKTPVEFGVVGPTPAA